MTSGKIENALWKKLQGEISDGNVLVQDGKMTNVPSSEKHQISLNELMSHGQTSLNNVNTLHNLNELLIHKNQNQFLNRMNQNLNQREIGTIEKMMNGYGLIRCLNRDSGLFFQYNSNLDVFKTGDFVEFNESVDKNNKQIAVNLVKISSNDPRISNQVNLKDLLQAQNQVFNQQQSNYENLLNELKKFKIQQQVQSGPNLNLLNKENFFNQSINANQQNNLLNMAKLTGLHQSSSLPDFKSLGSEYNEGTIAIAANQHQNPFEVKNRIEKKNSISDKDIKKYLDEEKKNFFNQMIDIMIIDDKLII
ncbi:cold shock domain-containing E1-like isoform X1 [Brachionus plicatilis]|uniref:Cold shock domain-containing E1-like isoform X1 n=1 Tax=Brachionus plicatilis TaxID=10195 RepID=A0A3M7R9D6_BRAPC|nr:cold shock domain-containing E1-like isoform X1 [Brachionus plicatilis]